MTAHVLRAAAPALVASLSALEVVQRRRPRTAAPHVDRVLPPSHATPLLCEGWRFWRKPQEQREVREAASAKRRGESLVQEPTGHVDAAVRPFAFSRESLISENKTSKLNEEYELLKLVGKGGYGSVYKARHRRTGIQRAIKSMSKLDPETMQTFVDEVETLIKLEHPNIVNLIETFREESDLYLVEELCSGPDLLDFLGESSNNMEDIPYLPERTASIIIRQCIKAVMCCHSHGFAHRDVKLENFVLSGGDDTVKLIDFGISKGIPATADMHGVAGTLEYMAPELLFNKKYTKQVDMWSLGVVLFVMLTGEPLLPDGERGIRTALRDSTYVERRLKRSAALRDLKISEDCMDLLHKMLVYDPDKRIMCKDALSHRFVLAHAHEFLGKEEGTYVTTEFDRDIINKMRRFSCMPRLKKMAWLTAVHLGAAQHTIPELDVAQHVFRRMDKNGKGAIRPEELKDTLRENNVEIPGDFKELFNACDMDCNETLTFIEFMAFCLPHHAISDKLVAEAFNLLDKECNQKLDAADLKLLCGHSEDREHDDAYYEAMIKEADLTGKGYLDLNDFRKMIKTKHS